MTIDKGRWVVGAPQVAQMAIPERAYPVKGLPARSLIVHELARFLWLILRVL